MKNSDELTGFICTGFSGIGWQTTPNFVKVLNFDKVEFEKTSTFLLELLRSCCRTKPQQPEQNVHKKAG